ncbi:type III-B CRISPR module RAMP protein Cmr1 [Chitinispirillales bacterium ANBcel5]|uniref:type III-B CRISPR module RAMP protein Cmr1 n=1 Tax=Cellulosispirillum alkaliphilum TaxID=3039283 RepID=UPI002A4FE2D3|nr:type III-B CRISPR module RAMP protein Cmr1 [Chitinispirillales bacterium ANBcel5]
MRLKRIPKISTNIIPNQNNGIVSKTYEFELITPMFGGDVESWKLNEKTPIRTQSLKGQLRFWWRTMQSETDCQKLLEKENKIWGGNIGKDKDGIDINIQAPVRIAITKQTNLLFETIKPKYKKESREISGLGENSLSNYVLFPVVEDIKNEITIKLLVKATFDVCVVYPKEFEPDVENTLKLWVLFGAVGARGRRGCGSIYCEELLKGMNSLEDVSKFLFKFTSQKIKGPIDYPNLIGAKLYATKNARTVKSLLDKYSEFRQARTKREGDTPGRSFWPEPDAIRTISSDYHQPEHPDGVWFPRAIFGLPIITKFNTSGSGKRDPDGCIELKPHTSDDKEERWPSPVFLKCSRLGNNEDVNLALILNQKFPDNMSLKGETCSKKLPTTANPNYQKDKKMIFDSDHPEKSLNGRTIFEAFADHMELKEII